MDVTLTELRGEGSPDAGEPLESTGAHLADSPLSLFRLIFYLRLFFDMSLIYQIKRTACNKSVCTIYNSIKRGQKGSRQSVPESLVDGAALQLIRWFENTHETKYLNPEKEPLYVSLEIKQFCMTKDN